MDTIRGEFAVAEKEKCEVTGLEDLQSVVKQGDIMLAGFFRLHLSKPSSKFTFRESPQQPDCFSFKSREFRYMMAMIFAIEKINNNSLLLPNVTLGYMIYDACFNTHKEVKTTVNFIGSEVIPMQENICKPRALIGSASSSFSIIVGRLLGSLYVPQVSYAATCKCLSDKNEYPSFLRTVPSDAFQSTAMARLVSHFHWDFVGALQNDDDYGKQGIAQFANEAENKGHCLDFIETLPNVDEVDKMRKLGEVVEKSKVSVIVVFSGDGKFSPFVEELWKRNITGKIWIASEYWATFKPYASERFAHMFQGTIGFALQRGSIPATYAVAHALHDLQQCIPGRGPLDNGTCAMITNFKSWQLLYYLKNVTFSVNKAETLFFDKNGDPPAVYEIVNWQKNNESALEFKVVGIFDSSYPQEQQLSFLSRDIFWNDGSKKVPSSLCSYPCQPGTRKAARKGEPLCCHDCIDCPQGKFSNETVIGMVLVTAVMVMMYTQRELHLVKAESFEVNLLLLVALGGCFCSTLAFMGKPTDNLCSLRETCPCILLSFAIICMLAKCIKGFIASKGMMYIAVQNKDSSSNEGKFITYNMLFLLMVVVAFIPAYISTQGKHTIITEMFAIIAATFAFLGCSFVPKCYKMYKKIK
uniref:extracellular calcium-sensing receptor-like n=1 Tax=Myxine glutinosa TaxID=7769 RepID=UPI00358E2AEC